ncbi:MAG: hypothetical protein GY834_09750 [Bacteroidetes bacterium]|nr:hypothetical protein [Bacteroidota bacterium]
MIKEKLDALWVMLDWREIDSMLIDLLDLNGSLFIEKPIVLSNEKIEQAIKIQSTRVSKIQIGCNRRFYNFIPRAMKIFQYKT